MLKKLLLTALTAMLLLAVTTSAFAVSRENPLDDKTKQAYYAQYVKIAEEVAKQRGIDIIVNPMQEFAEEDWKTPEDFRNFVTKIAEWDIRCDISSVPEQFSTSKTKIAKLDVDGESFEIAITGTFTTQYNANTRRQHFQRVDAITSEMSNGSASWTQTGYENQPMDAARTVATYVSGTLKAGQVTFQNKLAYVEFYCKDTGVVS